MEKMRRVFNSWYLFIPRLIVWIGCTFVCPIVLILVKFKAFERIDGEKLKFNGWAIVIALIVTIGVFYILKYILSAMTFNYIDGTQETVTYYRLSEFYYVTAADDDIWFACSDAYVDAIVTAMEECLEAMEAE